MKYIDAELLSKIKAEIKRRIELHDSLASNAESEMIANLEIGAAQGLDDLLPFLSTLESESPINPDDAMKELHEKIALVKQRGTWDGVDVDKYMDEVRGREPEKPMNQEGLEEEINRLWESFADEMEGPHNLFDIYARLAHHFANWQKEQMMKEAVEGYVNYYEDSGGILMAEAQVGCPYHSGDRVRIIVIPNTDEK